MMGVEYTIPFVDLKAQYATISNEIHAAIESTLVRGQFVLGDEVAAFEDEFATYSGAKFGVGVNSGTSALHLALLAAGVGPGDEVITVSLTFSATVAAIEYTGARPVFVDVDPETLNMDPENLRDVIGRRTKAILPVHLHGHPADMAPILEIARQYGLRVIEDAAQAHGAEYQGRRVGSFGDLACFSFYPGKNLGAYGEAGMVLTNDYALAKVVRMLRDWGQEEKHHHVLKGFNYRMDGLQGAILRVKLRHLAEWTDVRRQIANCYNKLLSKLRIRTPVEKPYARHVYHVYAIQTAQRDAVRKRLEAQGVQTGIHYPIPVHLQEAYLQCGNGVGSLPVTERAAKDLLSLPIFPELLRSHIDKVSQTVSDALYD